MPTCPTCRGTYGADRSRCPIDDEPLLPDEAFRSADPPVPPGTMVGEYRVEAQIGAGSFGTVYRAVHPIISKAAAVKVLSRQWSNNPEMVSRFIAEARATNQIRHKNIVDIFAFGALQDGRQYYVMELLDGQPFDRLLSDRGRLAPEVALPILRGIARALDAAHAQGIVHRDLKPENVFLLFDEGAVQPKLLDFGIAKLLGDAAATHKTRTGAPIGTPSYMSPEQCHGRAIDARSDIYSLGVMTHEVLTGQRLFDGESVMDVLLKHMYAPAPAMTRLCPELPAALDGPVLRMLAKDPAARPGSAGAAIDALVAAAQGVGIAVGAMGTLAVSKPAVDSRHSSWGPAGPPIGRAAQFSSMSSSGADGAGRTFMGAERDVAHRPGRRALLLVAAVAAVGLSGGAAAVLVAKRAASPEHEPNVAATAAVSRTVPASPSPPSAVAAVSLDVGITVESNVPGASVWLGTKRVGDASSPIYMPRGTDKVTLTLKADGYAPGTAEVVPSEDAVVVVKLVKLPNPRAGASAGRRMSRDLENPF